MGRWRPGRKVWLYIQQESSNENVGGQNIPIFGMSAIKILSMKNDIIMFISHHVKDGYNNMI